jgi:hypothetical protein
VHARRLHEAALCNRQNCCQIFKRSLMGTSDSSECWRWRSMASTWGGLCVLAITRSIPGHIWQLGMQNRRNHILQSRIMSHLSQSIYFRNFTVEMIEWEEKVLTAPFQTIICVQKRGIEALLNARWDLTRIRRYVLFRSSMEKVYSRTSLVSPLNVYSGRASNVWNKFR